MTSLIVAPKFDTATEYSHEWIMRLIKEHGFNPDYLLDIYGATKKSFDQNWPILDPDTLIFYDHGNETGLIANPEEGSDRVEYLLYVNKVYKLKNKAVFTMACLSAKKFGLEAYKARCKEYWGAIESIGFIPSDERLFGEVYNMGVKMRFQDGHSITDTLKAMEAKFNENIDKATNGFTKMWLRKDRDMWRCWSDETPPPEEETKCFFRKLAVRYLGAKGWKIPSLYTMLTRWGELQEDFPTDDLMWDD